MNLINVVSLCKKYHTPTKEIIALDDITFDIEEGKILGIIGTSGCGKSTLFNIITKLEKPTSGYIKENKKLADAFFARYSDLFDPKPLSAGPVAFHKFKLDMPIEDFCQLAVDKKGVLLLPSHIYDMESPYFRMGYGRKGFAESLKKFEEFLIEEGFAK